VRYACWQEEKGTLGTPHLQGYAVFESNRRLSVLKAMCPGAHWERRMGTHMQAKDYATKAKTRERGPWFVGNELSCFLVAGTTVEELGYTLNMVKYGPKEALEMWVYDMHRELEEEAGELDAGNPLPPPCQVPPKDFEWKETDIKIIK